MSYNFTKEQIENAFNQTQTAIGAAKLLGIKIDTYKKYAERFGCYRTNQSGKGLKKSRTFVEPTDINIHYFDNLSTNSQAYVLGFISADGTIKKNTLRFFISNKDKEILEYICSEMNIDKNKIIDYVGWYKKDEIRHEFPCSRLYITSKYMVNQLKEFGIETNRVSNNINLLKNIPEQRKISWLAGYLDGNGTFYKNNRRVEITTNNSTFEEIKKILNQYDINEFKKRDFGKYITFRFSANSTFIRDYLGSNNFLLSRKSSMASMMLSRMIHKGKN